MSSIQKKKYNSAKEKEENVIGKRISSLQMQRRFYHNGIFVLESVQEIISWKKIRRAA